MCAERGHPGTSGDVPDHEGTRDLKNMGTHEGMSQVMKGHTCNMYGTWDLKDVCRQGNTWLRPEIPDKEGKARTVHGSPGHLWTTYI